MDQYIKSRGLFPVNNNVRVVTVKISMRDSKNSISKSMNFFFFFGRCENNSILIILQYLAETNNKCQKEPHYIHRPRANESFSSFPEHFTERYSTPQRYRGNIESLISWYCLTRRIGKAVTREKIICRLSNLFHANIYLSSTPR